ncbi:MAG: hypothetical protein ACUVRJ_09545 [Candidatus Villigracilaceae bacterium]
MSKTRIFQLTALTLSAILILGVLALSMRDWYLIRHQLLATPSMVPVSRDCGQPCLISPNQTEATQTPTEMPLPTGQAMPSIQCTPPPCAIGINEIYYCPEICPGGCGTVCATYTPSSEN